MSFIFAVQERCEYVTMTFSLLFCRTHGHEKEETVAKGGRVQKEKGSSILSSVWWTWCLFLNTIDQTPRRTHTRTVTQHICWHMGHQSFVALVGCIRTPPLLHRGSSPLSAAVQSPACFHQQHHFTFVQDTSLVVKLLQYLLWVGPVDALEP